MERLCTHCHAQIAPDFPGDWCPACGGALAERPALPNVTVIDTAPAAQISVDHRGVLLPPRHALGGIITPQ